MEILTIQAIDAFVLISIGVILIALESFLLSFVIAWFGIGFILVGLLSFYYTFENGYNQLAVVSIISLVLLFILKKRVKEYFLKSKEKAPTDNFLNESGYAVIRNNLVYFKGTYFEIENYGLDIKEGDKVFVVSTNKNFATIKKSDSENKFNNNEDK